MTDEPFVTVQGFKPFTSLWYDACRQISQECNKEIVDNDIKLFTTLRNIVLSSEHPTFLNSYKLTDFNTPNNRVRSTLSTPIKNSVAVSWNRILQPYTPVPHYKHIKPANIKYKPAPVSYLHVGETKIIGHKHSITIKNDCVFETPEPYTSNHKVYTVIDNDFVVKLDKTKVLYNVSMEIMAMFANNQKSRINLRTFQDLTNDMYQKLLLHRSKMK